MRIPLHGKATDITIHRQQMINATGGKGFHPAFMERTMIEAGLAAPAFFKKEPSKRQLARRAARALYLARCKVSSRALNKDRAGITARVQSRMYQEVMAATV